MRKSGFAIAALLPALAFAEAEPYTPAQKPRVTPVVELVRQNRDAIVNIAATQVIEVRSGFFDFFDTPYARRMKTNSVGSGAVIHPSGYILTNAHVVAQATELKAIFADTSELPAEIVASLTEEDLAVIRVKPTKPLKAVRLGRSNDLMVGETVVAIGNPLGLQHTVTTGIVSALGRDLEKDEEVKFHDIIQTDAAINPGNSGGPLLNILGELVGVNTAIRTDAQNVGFAIPADRVRALLPDLLAVESKGRVKLGIGWGTEIADERQKGVSIARIEPESPAAKARLVQGQVVTAVAGTPTPSVIDALVATLAQPVGRPFPVTVSDGASTRDVRVTIEELPRPNGDRLAQQRFGLKLAPLSQEAAARLGLRSSALVVQDVLRGGPAQRAGLERGDILTQVGRYSVRDLEALGLLLDATKPGDELVVTLVRARGRSVFRTAVSMVLR